jgi:uncharacterized protein
LTLERWQTTDGDHVEIQRLRADAGRPHLLILHGLEGGTRSHYVGGFFAEAARRGWAASLLLFRGCGSRPSTASRFYHSGDTSDLAAVVDRLARESEDSPLLLSGVSLGGNVLLKYVGERSATLSPRVRAVAAISVPFDLERSARHIGRGISRVYDRHFLRSLRRKAEAKLRQYPELFDASALRAARSIFEFDDAVTAPVHGFRDARDYYRQSSAIRWIPRISVPTLLLSATDDPFLPREVLDDVRVVAASNNALTVEFTETGGHVGFIGGRVPWRPMYYAEWRACEFLSLALSRRA